MKFDEAFLAKHPGWSIYGTRFDGVTGICGHYDVVDCDGDAHTLEAYVFEDGPAGFREPNDEWEGPKLSFRADPENAITLLETFLGALEVKA